MIVVESIFNMFSRIYRKICKYFFSLCARILRCRGTPLHIAYIADGNRTYSKRHGISRHEAYIKGMEKILHQINLSSILRITDLTFFIYSRHNNRRNISERNDILAVIELFLKLLLSNKEDYRYNIIGDASTLPLSIHFLCNRLLNRSSSNSRIVINLAINYSAKTEICWAFERLLNQDSAEWRFTEPALDDFMYTAYTRSPDLIIRTSGQRRLSDFYLWQSVHSMLFFMDQCWPEFSDWHLLKVIFCHQFFTRSKCERTRKLGHPRHRSYHGSNEDAKTC